MRDGFMRENDVDVLIVGGGLAGLCLARHLLLATDKRILLVDRREIPAKKQKVGEATVQMSGYYYSRVLDLEEHLLQHHYLKYNLRFYWPSDRGGSRYEDLSQSYIRQLSNIATYQLDRNVFEAEVLRLNKENPRCEIYAPMSDLDVTIADEAPHSFRFKTEDGEEIHGKTAWVVDASGRGKFLGRKLGLMRKSPIRHGTSFMWVEGNVNPERLTDLSPDEIRKHPNRSSLGHIPVFLATNHFCGEGYWFWQIPLHGKTSLGLVYEHGYVDKKEVANAQGLVDWVCREQPLFARDLRERKILHHSGYVDFAFDLGQTLSASGWAFVGEACRFTDPLYSPGGDLISMYNTLVVDAIKSPDRAELERKVRYYESLARAIYEAYVPSYSVGQPLLGDQESFSLRYIWELTIYFGFYVFPFINDLFTDPSFLPGFLRRFSRLGPWNHSLQHFLVGYYRWKKENLSVTPKTGGPVFFDFTEVGALKMAEACFYKVGVSSEEARQVLDGQLVNLEALLRWIVAHLASVVIGVPEAASNAAFIAGFDLDDLRFDPEELRARWEACADTPEKQAWPFDVPCMRRFHPELSGQVGQAGMSVEVDEVEAMA
jgi:2-polyprenyl-6-methoxyphenol hydroxylase-like FAD-dependent oxidoreductase